jgi:hypothetical protein
MIVNLTLNFTILKNLEIAHTSMDVNPFGESISLTSELAPRSEIFCMFSPIDM